MGSRPRIITKRNKSLRKRIIVYLSSSLFLLLSLSIPFSCLASRCVLLAYLTKLVATQAETTISWAVIQSQIDSASATYTKLQNSLSLSLSLFARFSSITSFAVFPSDPLHTYFLHLYSHSLPLSSLQHFGMSVERNLT